MTRPPIFYFTRVLPAYRLPVLERLDERLGHRLVVCHGAPPRSTSTLIARQEGSFRQEMLTNYWFRGETLHAQPFGSVFQKYGDPAVVLAEESPRSLTLPFLLYHARKRGAGRVLWGIFYSVFRPFSGLARLAGADDFETSGAEVDRQLHLHARRVVVPHPSGRGLIDVTAPLPPHMVATWRYFGFEPSAGEPEPLLEG